MLLRNQQLDPLRFASKSDDWSVVSASDCLPAAGDFGHDLFAQLLDEHPDLRDDMVCFRYSSQPEDSWVIFDRLNSAFGIQLDPLLGYIIVFDSQVHNEIGPWFDDPMQQALDFVKQQYFQSHTPPIEDA